MEMLGFKISEEKDILILGEIIDIKTNIDIDFRLECDFKIILIDKKVLEIGLYTGKIACKSNEYLFTYASPKTTNFIIQADFYDILLKALSIGSFTYDEFRNFKNGDVILIKCISNLGKIIPKSSEN